MTGLALLIAACAFAAEPPAYNPAQPVRALREAGQATLSAVNDALSTNIIKENVAAEKANFDRLGQHAREASDAAQALLAACQPPLGEVKTLLDGSSSRPSCDRRRKEGGEALALAQDRLRADSDRKTDYDSRADRIEKPDERARVKALLADAGRSLTQAGSCLGQSGDSLSAVKEQQDAVRSAANHVASSQEEMERAEKTLVARAASAQSTTSDAKAALDALGDDNATKARAFDRAQAAEDDGKAVFNQASILALRSDDFSSRYSALLSASSRFDAADKSFKGKLAECDGPLAAAEQSLNDAKEQIK